MKNAAINGRINVHVHGDSFIQHMSYSIWGVKGTVARYILSCMTARATVGFTRNDTVYY